MISRFLKNKHNFDAITINGGIQIASSDGNYINNPDFHELKELIQNLCTEERNEVELHQAIRNASESTDFVFDFTYSSKIIIRNES